MGFALCAGNQGFTLLLGAGQTRLDAALVETLMEDAATVQLVRLTSFGKNALDFALAYYVGRAVMANPTGWFHIVSKDTGFDPLIEHLRSRHIHAQRHDDFTRVASSTCGCMKSKFLSLVCGRRVTGDQANIVWRRLPGAQPGQTSFPFYIAHCVRCTDTLDQLHGCRHDCQNLDTGIGYLSNNLKIDFRKVRRNMELLAQIG